MFSRKYVFLPVTCKFYRKNLAARCGMWNTATAANKGGANWELN